MENKKSVFVTLNEINVNEHTEKKPTGNNKELTYLSWPWSWAEVKKRYPDASYTIYKDENNKPYIEDPDFGLMCMTTVTIEGQTHEMWLPVMDGSNKAMRRQPYSYKVKNNFTKQWEDRWVQAATMFDINKTIMRCLVKNLAMFGLGLYIYAGEDLPDTEKDGDAPAPEMKKSSKASVKSAAPDKAPSSVPMQTPQAKPAVEQKNLTMEEAKKKIDAAKTKEELATIFNENKHLQSDKDFIGMLSSRKNQILKDNGTAKA